MDLPFIEKYRPRTLAEVAGNREILARLRAFCKTGSLPNLLLASPPGLGKTTIVWALAREMLGASFKTAFLELNASDERNLSDIRTKVKTFVQRQITLPPRVYKLVFLDEIDMMADAAQGALRRLMEDYSSTTRFCLACNNLAKVIEPLQSRCCLLQLSPVPVPELVGRLERVCASEGISYDANALSEIAQLSGGDVRDALNSLQAVSASGGTVTKQRIFEVLDLVDPKEVAEGMGLAEQGRLQESLRLFSALLSQGFSVEDLVGGIYRYALDASTPWPDVARTRVLRAVAQLHSKVVAVVSSQVQLGGFLAEVSEVFACPR